MYIIDVREREDEALLRRSFANRSPANGISSQDDYDKLSDRLATATR